MKDNLLTPKGKVDWIDSAKGIAMLLVILGHTSALEGSEKYVYSFHMPMFFLLSGYVTGLKKPTGFLEFLKKKSRAILIPYCVFYGIIYVYFFFIGSRFGETSGLDLWLPIKGFFYASGDNLKDLFRPMWFLTCLFVVSTGFFWIRKVGNRIGIMVLLVSCSILGYLTSLHLKPFFRPPWHMDTALTAVVFFGAGCLLAEKGIEPKKFRTASKLILISILIATNIFVASLNGGPTLLSNYFGNYFYFYIAAFAGIFGYTLLADRIKFFKPLHWVGKNSLGIFAVHLMALGIIRWIFTTALGLRHSVTHNPTLWGIGFTIAIVLASTPAIYVFNTYFPFMVGKKAVRKVKSK